MAPPARCGGRAGFRGDPAWIQDSGRDFAGASHPARRAPRPPRAAYHFVSRRSRARDRDNEDPARRHGTAPPSADGRIEYNITTWVARRPVDHPARFGDRARIIALDVSPERLERAKEFGAWETVNQRSNEPIGAIKDRPGAADFTLYTSSQPEGRIAAVRSAKVWGTVCFVCERNTLTIDVSRRRLPIHAERRFVSDARRHGIRSFGGDGRMTLCDGDIDDPFVFGCRSQVQRIHCHDIVSTAKVVDVRDWRCF